MSHDDSVHGDEHEAVLDRLGQLICGVQGHDEMVQFDGTRMFLRCVHCGHETPGWDVSRRPAAQPDRRTAPFGAHADTPRAA